MKATFTYPPPKSALSKSTGYEAQLTDESDPKLHTEALKNFALLVFRVHEAERLDLKMQPYGREVMREGVGTAEWRVDEVCP